VSGFLLSDLSLDHILPIRKSLFTFFNSILMKSKAFEVLEGRESRRRREVVEGVEEAI
jgi:hypothetical protein